MNIDIFWRSNVNEDVQKNDTTKSNDLKSYIDNLINDN